MKQKVKHINISAKHTCRGFTLLEMLLVLVLFSMVIALLMQGLVYVKQLNERTGETLLVRQQQQLQHDWLQGLLKGLRPLNWREAGLFQGRQDGLQGMTVHGLRRPVGHLTFFKLQLQATTLTYQEGSETPILLWNGRAQESSSSDATWSFRYQDTQGQWHGQWLSNPADKARAPLPVRICLCRDDGEPLVVVALENARYPPHDLRDMEAGL